MKTIKLFQINRQKTSTEKPNDDTTGNSPEDAKTALNYLDSFRVSIAKELIRGHLEGIQENSSVSPAWETDHHSNTINFMAQFELSEKETINEEFDKIDHLIRHFFDHCINYLDSIDNVNFSIPLKLISNHNKPIEDFEENVKSTVEGFISNKLSTYPRVKISGFDFYSDGELVSLSAFPKEKNTGVDNTKTTIFTGTVTEYDYEKHTVKIIDNEGEKLTLNFDKKIFRDAEHEALFHRYIAFPPTITVEYISTDIGLFLVDVTDVIYSCTE